MRNGDRGGALATATRRPAPTRALHMRAEGGMRALVDVAVFGLVPLPVTFIWSCGDDDIMARRVVHRFNTTTEEIPSWAAQDRRCVQGEMEHAALSIEPYLRPYDGVGDRRICLHVRTG